MTGGSCHRSAECGRGSAARPARSAKHTIRKASSLLRKRLEPRAAENVSDGKRGVCWHGRRARCAAISNAHLERVASGSLRARAAERSALSVLQRTFGTSPHVSCPTRLNWDRYMLETDASLSDIALRSDRGSATYASTFDRPRPTPAVAACAHGKRRPTIAAA